MATAIRRADVARHQDWVTRAYALALGAGIQVLTQGFGNAVFGVSELTTDLMLGAGWAMNVMAAELKRTSRAAVQGGVS